MPCKSRDEWSVGPSAPALRARGPARKQPELRRLDKLTRYRRALLSWPASSNSCLNSATRRGRDLRLIFRSQAFEFRARDQHSLAKTPDANFFLRNEIVQRAHGDAHRVRRALPVIKNR